MMAGGKLLRAVIFTSGLFALGMASLGTPLPAAAGEGFILATGRTTGKSYAVGVGISSLAKVKLLPLYKMDLSAVESKGFVDNVRMLQRNEAQFAILQAMFGHFARTGTGTFAGEEPNDDIRAIAMLWRDADHFVINRNYLKTGTIADLEQLEGMPVSMGLDGPGPIESNRLLLSHFNVDIDKAFELAYLNYRDSTQALKRGEIKAMSTPIRPPAPHIQEALSSKDGDGYALLQFTDDQIAQADGGLGLWTRYVIPAATYPGQDQDIQTVAKSNLLVVRQDVDDEVVYQVTKAMFENLDFLRNINDAMYETSLDQALVGMPMPLHPGALRYYQEIGLLGPGTSLDVALADGVQRAKTAAYNPNGALKAEWRAAAAKPDETVLSALASAADADRDKTFVIYFDLNQKTVGEQASEELARISTYADQLTHARITIAGHTDRSGDPAYNAYLAGVRATAVAEALTHRYGVDGHDLKIETFGAAAPAVDDEREYQPRNRRVEVTVTPVDDVEASKGSPVVRQDDGPVWETHAPI